MIHETLMVRNSMDSMSLFSAAFTVVVVDIHFLLVYSCMLINEDLALLLISCCLHDQYLSQAP
jgi:hypothetical protein